MGKRIMTGEIPEDFLFFAKISYSDMLTKNMRRREKKNDFCGASLVHYR